MISLKTTITNSATPRMLRVMEEAKRIGSRSTKEFVSRKAQDLAMNLSRECKKIAKPIPYYTGLAASLNYRLRRPSDSQRGKGTSTKISDEIKARKASRNYLSSFWLLFKYAFRGGKKSAIIKPVKKPGGEVVIKWPSAPGQEGSVTLINRAKNKREGEIIASQIHEKYGIVPRAMNATTRDMIQYIRRKRGEVKKEVLDTK